MAVIPAHDSTRPALDIGDVDAAACEQEGERTRPASDVEHAAPAVLLSDRRVGAGFAPVAVEEIADTRRPRIFGQTPGALRQAVRASIRCSVTDPGSSSSSTCFTWPGSDR